MDDLSPADAVQHVTLVGTQPAGLSLALSWKNARPGLTITGYGEAHAADAQDPLAAAEAAGALDRKAASPDVAAADADLVLLAERLPTALRRLEALAPHLAEGTLVTDTGAVKQPIARHAAEVLPEGVAFVGGHPVASPDAPPAPDAERFDGGTYFLCPPEAPADAESALEERHPALLALAEATGARIETLTAARHDRLAATARDLPELLTATLAHLVSEEGDAGAPQHEALHALMPEALRPLVWGRPPLSGERREELVAGEGALLDALGRYVRALQQTRRHLAAGDLDAALKTDEA